MQEQFFPFFLVLLKYHALIQGGEHRGVSQWEICRPNLDEICGEFVKTAALCRYFKC